MKKKVSGKSSGNGEKKLSYAEFFRQAIINLRKPPYKGIHSVYSGFNKAFKDYYGEADLSVREAQEELVAEGKLIVRPVKGGVMFYLPDDAPNRDSGDVLNKILNGKGGNKR
jgi:hypothetical protein